MKKISLIAITIFGLASLPAQTPVADKQTKPVAEMPPPTAPQVVERGANHRVWQWQSYEPAPNGRTMPRIHKYQELATGMHYKDAGGHWVESSELIEAYQGGAVARRGQYQVIFANNLNTAGAIDVQTPDGKNLRSSILGLGYLDHSTGDSVIIAQIQDSPGQLISANQVLYPNAFNGVKADVCYTYKKGSFEQDVILREQPPTPESFGLNPATTELEVMTEFIRPPRENTKIRKAGRNGETDQQVSWGTMRIGQGRAFKLGSAKNLSKGNAVTKKYMTVNGRKILMEAVPVASIQTDLSQLPLQSSNSKKLPYLVAKGLTVPETPSINTNQSPMKLASVTPSNQGYVLDYILCDANPDDITFQGDTTYLISGEVDIGGTATFESGTVLKFGVDTENPAIIQFWHHLVCNTSPYRPAVLTSQNDDTVGESMSVGGPMNYWQAIAEGGADGDLIHDMRISYAGYGVNTYNINISDCQFVNCQYPLDINWGNCNLTNVLMVNVGTPFYGSTFTATAYHLTVNGATDNQLCGDWASYNTSTINLINSLLVNVGDDGAAGTVTTNNTVRLTCDSSLIFQTVGAGSCYLATNSPYHNAGTTNLDAGILADLAQKTTYPPVVFAGTTIGTPTTFSPQAPRDNTGIPDLGYHYDPLDYAFGGVDVYTNITFTAGTAVCSFELDDAGGSGYGLGLSNTVTAAFDGTVTAPCTFVRYSMVQEGGNGAWMNRGYLGGIVNDFNYDPYNPARLVAQFTRFAHLVYDPNHFRDGNSGQPIRVQANNCEFLGQNGGYNIYTTFTNCLFYRAYFGQATADSAYTGEVFRQIYRNCTFYGGGLWMLHWESVPFWKISVRDCSFDNATIDLYPPWNDDLSNWDWTWLDADFNAFNTNTVTFPQESDLTAMPGVSNVYVADFNWQNSWLGNFYLPADSPLINTGDLTADQMRLYHFTTQTDQAKETNSIVDIGFHYVAVDAYGNPIDSNGDEIPDYLEDANGNGIFDTGDLSDWRTLAYSDGTMTFSNSLKLILLEPKSWSVIP